MLVVQALVNLLELVEANRLPESLVSDTTISTKISLAIFHASTRTIDAQENGGSWNQSVEETAYAVILISAAARVTMFDPIRQRLVDAVRAGEKWLQQSQHGASPLGEHLWIGKVTYGSSAVTRAFRLAALKSASLLAANSTIGHCLGTADFLPTMEEKYYGEAVCKHSAAMCRMYNDLGSIARDTAEKNLNSVHFPEFDKTLAETRKQALWDIAQFEREAFEDARARMERATKKRMAGMGEKEKKATELRIKYWRMYCNITDLYGQIWVVKDFSAPVFQPAR